MSDYTVLFHVLVFTLQSPWFNRLCLSSFTKMLWHEGGVGVGAWFLARHSLLIKKSLYIKSSNQKSLKVMGQLPENPNLEWVKFSPEWGPAQNPMLHVKLQLNPVETNSDLIYTSDYPESVVLFWISTILLRLHWPHAKYIVMSSLIHCLLCGPFALGHVLEDSLM